MFLLARKVVQMEEAFFSGGKRGRVCTVIMG